MVQLSENISSYILKIFGRDFLDKYTEFVYAEYLPSLRISLLENEEQIKNELFKYGIKLEAVKEIKNAYRIAGGSEKAGKTLEHTLGKYYIQSVSSMIPPIVLNPGENDRVLDLCSAPGSKLTQLAEIMKNRGTLYANEVSVDRIKSLVFNIEKMNFTNTGVLNFKGEILSKIYNCFFDKILVDAPCSGLGIVQKKGEVSNWWNEKQAEKLSDIQFKLILSAIKMLKVGGELVYSTCTMTIEENEFVIDKILKKYPVEIVDIELPVHSVEAFTRAGDTEFHKSLAKGRRILPWEINSEGFFIVKLRKLEEVEKSDRLELKNKNLKLINYRSNYIKNHLQELSSYYGADVNLFSSYQYLFKGNDIFFVNADWEADSVDEFIRVGTKFGSIDKGNRLNLHTLSAQILGNNFNDNVVELNKDDLYTYMNGGTIKKQFEAPGPKVTKFGNYVLGMASNSKDGLKSQFPRALRTHEIMYNL